MLIVVGDLIVGVGALHLAADAGAEKHELIATLRGTGYTFVPGKP